MKVIKEYVGPTIVRKVWMFVNFGRQEFYTDCIGDTEEQLLAKAKKQYNKTDAELRGWVKAGTVATEVSLGA